MGVMGVGSAAGGEDDGARSARGLAARGLAVRGPAASGVFGVVDVVGVIGVSAPCDAFALRAAETACANAPGGTATIRHKTAALSRFGRMANFAIRSPGWRAAIGRNAVN